MPFQLYISRPLVALFVMLVLLLEITKPPFNKWVCDASFISWASYLRILAMVGIMSLSTMAFDGYLIQKIQSIDFSAKEALVDVGSSLGKDQGSWMLLCFIYFIGYVGSIARVQRLACFSLLGSGLAGLIAHLLKFAILRARPDQFLGPYSFFNFFTSHDSYSSFQSFPSGDVAVVAGAAGYLFLVTKARGAGWLFLILPIVTAISRIDLNRHWPSDTLFAMGLGLVVGMFLRDYELGRNVTASIVSQIRSDPVSFIQRSSRECDEGPNRAPGLDEQAFNVSSGNDGNCAVLTEAKTSEVPKGRRSNVLTGSRS